MKRVAGLFLITVGAFIELMSVVSLIIALLVNPQNVPLIAVAAFGIIVGTALLILGIVITRRSPPLTSPHATPAGTLSGNYVSHTPQHRALDGTPYTIVYTPPVKGKNARPSVLKISTPVAFDGEFEIVPESGFDRFAKRWGLTTEIATLDATFDDQCFVRTDTAEFTRALLEHPDNRDIVRSLHRIGFKTVTLKDRELSTSWIGFDPSANDTPDLAEEIGARLILMARKTPTDLPEPDTSGASRRRRWQLILWPALIAFGLLILSLIPYTPMHFSEVLVRGLIVLLGVFPASLFTAGWLLSGTSRSHYAWLFWSIAGIFLLPAGCIGAVTLVNGAFDDSPDEHHRIKILRKYTTKSKNSTNYHVECESLRTPGEKEKFQITSAQYNRIVDGQSQLHVVTRPGQLGVEWLRSKDVETPNKPKNR